MRRQCIAAAQPDAVPDRIYVNARVCTADAAQPSAEDLHWRTASLCLLCGWQLRVIGVALPAHRHRSRPDPQDPRPRQQPSAPRLPPRRAESHPNLPDLFAER